VECIENDLCYKTNANQLLYNNGQFENTNIVVRLCIITLVTSLDTVVCCVLSHCMYCNVVKLCCVEGLMEDRCTSHKHSR